MRNLVVGMGEIGNAVEELLTQAGDTAITYDRTDKQLPRQTTVDVLHVCFPYAPDFIGAVMDYMGYYSPSLVIVWSTVPIGTTKNIPSAVHSPVEGRHPNLLGSIKTMPRWVGCNDPAGKLLAEAFFNHLRLTSKVVPSSDYTEALKLLSTTEYGVNLLFADYKAAVAKDIGMDYSLVKGWNRDYNYLYDSLGERQFQKFVLDPPNGKIGGHCVVPNAELLDDQYPSDMLKMIKEMKS